MTSTILPRRARPPTPEPVVVRVAIYARKSTDKVTDADYTTIDNQLQSCRNYIASQRDQGWVEVGEPYADPGYSAATLNRPAMQRLLADVQSKAVDIVVAYRRQLVARLAEIESELADLDVDGVARRGRRPGRAAGRRGPGRPPGRRGLGRPPKAGRRGRSGNAMSLPAMLAKAVRVGSTVSPQQATEAVKRAGYKSTSKTLGVMVAMALAKSPVFKRVGRGQYVRRPGELGPPAKRGPKPKMGPKARRGRKARRGSKRGRKPGRKAARRGRPPKAATSAAAATPAA